MCKIGYITLQKEIKKRLKANNSVAHLTHMELKKPLVAFSNDKVYITDNCYMFFIIPKDKYTLPYGPNIDESAFKAYVNVKAESRLYYENDTNDLNDEGGEVAVYCPYLDNENVKVRFIKYLLKRFYKDIDKLHLYNDGTKEGITHVYRNGTLVGVITTLLRDSAGNFSHILL